MKKNFELFKIRNSIKRCGIEVDFKRPVINEYGEPEYPVEGQGGCCEVLTLKVIYHETNSYVKQETEDGATYRTKKSPMLLAIYDDAKDVQVGDVIEISGNVFKVTGLNNVGQGQVVLDISLELQDGDL